MNLLPAETISELRRAWEKGLSLRKTARAVGVNRNTVGQYFRLWLKDPTVIDPIAREEMRGSAADPESSDLYCMITPALKSKLIEAAKHRKTSLSNFVGFLLDVIVEDGLIPAIMEETRDDDIPRPQPVKRKCLCCDAAFFSAHKYNRLCRECAAAGAEGPGDPAVDYISNGAAIIEGRMGGFVRGAIR